jgi:hypothetical protein
VPASDACDGDVVSQSTYDGTYALPLTIKSFGKLQQTLGYDTASSVASGQRGTLKTTKDGNNNVTTYTNWKRGIPQTVAFADSNGRTAVVDGEGWITSVTDENGYKTCYAYDVMGRISQITPPSEAASGTCNTSAWAATTQAFEKVASVEMGIPAGHWRQTVATGNARRITYFDAMWRPLVTREYDAANESGTKHYQRFAYDHAGRTTFASYPGTTDALTAGTRTTYDPLGRVTRVEQDSELGILGTDTAYLPNFQRSVTDARGHAAIASFLAWDTPSYEFPVLVDAPEEQRTTIIRDAFGKPVSIARGATP